MKVDIKPLSVNKCWKGKRFKTDAYKAYENHLLLLLKPLKLPDAPYHLIITFGFSNKLSDVDNGVKPFQDILQKKYDFDDREIYCLSVRKVLVEKGEEFIDFNIQHYEV